WDRGSGGCARTDRRGGPRLACPGPAPQPNRLARTDAEAHVAKDGPLCALYLQPDGQSLDVDKRRAGRGSSAVVRCEPLCLAHRLPCACSNNRSPSTLNAITTATMHAPAASAGSG